MQEQLQELTAKIAELDEGTGPVWRECAAGLCYAHAMAAAWAGQDLCGEGPGSQVAAADCSSCQAAAATAAACTPCPISIVGVHHTCLPLSFLQS